LLRQQWRKLLLLGVFGIGLTNTLVYVAVRTTTATNAVILNSATPMMVLVLGSLYFRQKLARRQWAGMLVAMAGALLIVLKGNVLGMSAMQFSRGDLLVLAAGLCWAVYTLGLRTLLPGLDALVMMMVLLLVGSACCCRHLCRKPGRLAVFTCCRCRPGCPCCIWGFSLRCWLS
jgi:drug/metabolite transporter (DMT)-like permease